jgi:hypothetical protein
MTTDEILHYRNGYAIGLVLADLRERGKRVTGTHTKPDVYPAPRVQHDVAAHCWGITTAMAGRPSLF